MSNDDYEEIELNEDDDDHSTEPTKKKRGRKPKFPPLELKIREFDLNTIPPHKPSDSSGVKIVVIGKAGCFAAGTKVLMYDGKVKNIEDIEVGEQVMGNDNTPRTVQRLHHGEQPMFTVLPADGSDSYTVNLMHDLVLQNKTTQRTIIVSVESFLQWSHSEQAQWLIFRSQGVDFSHDKDEQDVLLNAELFGRRAACDDDFVYEGIPDKFKYSSRQHRYNLLRGFVHRSTVLSNGEYQLTLSARKSILVDDILFIARSLGMHASVTRAVQGIGMGMGYDAVLVVRLRGLRLSNDLPYINQTFADHNTKAELNTSDFTLISQGTGNYYGFELDGNRLFLLASFDVVKNTGKSTLIKAILASKAHLAPVIQVYNGTEDNNGMYSTMCPPALVHDKLDLNQLVQFKNRQTLAAQHIPENPWAIQVIDDCTDDPKILRHPVVQAYYKNGRHWHMIHILSLQYSLDIPPNIRTNIDYTFLLRESGKKNIKKLYENYCPDCVESYEDFSQLMSALTEDFGALVICNRTTSNKIEDCIFYCKIDPKAISPAFRFGHQTTWDFSNERHDPDYVPSITST